MESVLLFRSSHYIDGYCEMLMSEGIARPNDFLGSSMEAMVATLLMHAACNSVVLDEFKQNHSFIKRSLGRAGLCKDSAYPLSARTTSLLSGLDVLT